ncbi:MAG: tRNA guanosine(34) transglycosylase Tgt [Patescibacteria group bacterium]|nr:tRNA guanosine(34) transglycosylase Tgt [Patescibacteria group bacterium]
MFQILKTSKISSARISRLATPHGTVDGPFFMPIATRGAVKHLAADELDAVGASIILSNTYHLSLRPGAALVARGGGLHRLMSWKKPILTDSGGFQVFSLARWRKVTDRGVEFRDPTTGQRVFLTPRRAIAIQRQLGSDILMVLDECVGFTATRDQIAAAVDRTTRWAQAAVPHLPRGRRRPLTFAIVQGGVYAPLRKRSAQALVAMPFDGYAIGGLALPGIHESRGKMLATVGQTAALLPPHKPRYLMGVGKPEEILAAVKLGVDMFDCVIPTREARHGRAYVWSQSGRRIGSRGNRLFYHTVQVKNKRLKTRFQPLDKKCKCFCCKNYTAAYLNHLFHVNEPLGQRLVTLHNLKFYLDSMAEIRRAIRAGSL